MSRGGLENTSVEGCWGWNWQPGGLEEDHRGRIEEDMK